ncbi:MAG: hypothetical protein IJN20_03115 [Oscillospiraceae bacterium]|nr:hypothetical protein [Oscillospiraceae bacterium]
MKKQNVGLGIMLMGLIVAQFPELAAWLTGMMLGVAGLMTILFGTRED